MPSLDHKSGVERVGKKKPEDGRLLESKTWKWAWSTDRSQKRKKPGTPPRLGEVNGRKWRIAGICPHWPFDITARVPRPICAFIPSKDGGGVSGGLWINLSVGRGYVVTKMVHVRRNSAF